MALLLLQRTWHAAVLVPHDGGAGLQVVARQRVAHVGGPDRGGAVQVAVGPTRGGREGGGAQASYAAAVRGIKGSNGLGRCRVAKWMDRARLRLAGEAMPSVDGIICTTEAVSVILLSLVERVGRGELCKAAVRVLVLEQRHRRADLAGRAGQRQRQAPEVRAGHLCTHATMGSMMLLGWTMKRGTEAAKRWPFPALPAGYPGLACLLLPHSVEGPACVHACGGPPLPG